MDIGILWVTSLRGDCVQDYAIVADYYAVDYLGVGTCVMQYLFLDNRVAVDWLSTCIAR
jgi:hypothetical protein